jgi:hypothetical protein
MPRLRREIEPSAVHAILDLNDPKVWIKRDFPLESLIRLAGIDVWTAVRPSKRSVDAERRVRNEGLRRGSIESRAPVQVIDLHKNGAGLRGASPAKDRAHPFHSASTQIGRDPDVGAQAQWI